MGRVEALFVRILGFIYLAAFGSLAVQVTGLIGSNGISPARDFLASMRQALGPAAYWYEPSVLWLNSSDRAILLVCVAGVVASLLVIAGVVIRPALVLLLLLYLSLSTAGQDFLSYQWDVLLLETGFLAIFLAGSPTRILLFRWLLFRLMFLSGAVKLLSRDAAWRNLTALHYHYETQPLPTPPAWYFYQLPMGFQKASTFVVLAVELAVPCLFFAPRRLRFWAAWITVGLQVLILLTGNYAFFNLLAIALCLFLFDDAALGRLLPKWNPKPLVRRAPMPAISAALAGFVLLVSGLEMVETFSLPVPGPARALLRLVSPLRIVNSYGLFAVMTTSRPEIIVEGSNDGANWARYEFRYKPGRLDRAPPWVAPHQPRLDWQMWFAALSDYRQNPWFSSFLLRLLQGSEPVLRLLEHNPFPDRAPRYIRALLFDYEFTGLGSGGAWWKQKPKGFYFPAASLRTQQ